MLERELEIAVEAAQRAAKAICDVYERDDFEIRQKADNRGPLTEADLAANQVILQTLRDAFPDDGILSEETPDDASRLSKERVWIVDPLDGTREFTLQIPEFAVSIGLSIAGEARLGVLLNPATRELFTGVVGVGATYNGAPCRVTHHATITGARLLVSRSEHKKGWFNAWQDDADLQPMGSVAYKFARVAAGLAEATFTPRPRSEWDLCGGVACVLAAGGRATNARGEPYRFNRPSPLVDGVCGSNGPLHAAVLEMMKDR